MIFGLDSGLVAEIEYSLEELGVDNRETITNNMLDYISGKHNQYIEKFYFENEYIFINYRRLDFYFSRKFREYKLNKITLVSNY